MLYGISRLFILMAIIVGIGFGLAWLSNSGGNLQLIFFNRAYSPSAVGVAVLIGLGLLGFWLLIELIRLIFATISFFLGDQNAFSRLFRGRRQKRGLEALKNALIALSSGDSATALKSAYNAQKRLDAPELTGLMIAQAAQAAGKTQEVEAAYKSVLEYPSTRFVAIQGLMNERLKNGDEKTARQLAQKALELNPKHSDTVNTYFELVVKDEDWAAARQALKYKVKAENLPADIARRREAVLAIAEAQKTDAHENPERYKELVELAHRLAPNLLPAVVLAAELKSEEGNIRAANSILTKAWSHEPHPDIAAAFGRITHDENPEAQLRQFNVLLKRQADHDETRMLHAELLIAAEDFPAAQKAMGPLADEPKTARAYVILAAIAHGMGMAEHHVRAYLSQASNASRGAQWVCNNCGHVHAHWEPSCHVCEQFDSFDWKIPPENSSDNVGFGFAMPLLQAENPITALDVGDEIPENMQRENAKADDVAEQAASPDSLDVQSENMNADMAKTDAAMAGDDQAKT